MLCWRKYPVASVKSSEDFGKTDYKRSMRTLVFFIVISITIGFLVMKTEHDLAKVRIFFFSYLWNFHFSLNKLLTKSWRLTIIPFRFPFRNISLLKSQLDFEFNFQVYSIPLMILAFIAFGCVARSAARQTVNPLSNERTYKTPAFPYLTLFAIFLATMTACTTDYSTIVAFIAWIVIG